MPNKNRTQRKKQKSYTEPRHHVMPPEFPAGDQLLQPVVEKPYPQPNTARAQNEINARSHNRSVEQKASRLMLAFQIILVLTTIIYTYFSYHQWRVTRDTLREGIATREIENRAYLNVKHPQMAKELTAGEKPTAVVTIFNTGNTPAQNVTMMTYIEGRDASAPEPDPSGIVITRVSSMGVIPQGIDISSEVKSETVLTDELIYRVNERQQRLYVWGLMEYKDMFGRQHRTGFCGVLTPGTRMFGMCSRGNFGD